MADFKDLANLITIWGTDQGWSVENTDPYIGVVRFKHPNPNVAALVIDMYHPGEKFRNEFYVKWLLHPHLCIYANDGMWDHVHFQYYDLNDPECFPKLLNDINKAIP